MTRDLARETTSELVGTAILVAIVVGSGIAAQRLSDALRKRWTDEVVKAAAVVVTMGCGDSCPLYPGKRYLDWSVTDPAGQTLEVTESIAADIEARVDALLDELIGAQL